MHAYMLTFLLPFDKHALCTVHRGNFALCYQKHRTCPSSVAVLQCISGTLAVPVTSASACTIALCAWCSTDVPGNTCVPQRTICSYDGRGRGGGGGGGGGGGCAARTARVAAADAHAPSDTAPLLLGGVPATDVRGVLEGSEGGQPPSAEQGVRASR